MRKLNPIYIGFLAYSVAAVILAFILSTPAGIADGLLTIITSEDTLITDYFSSAGPGAALINSALVTAVSVFLLYISRDPVNGSSIATLGLMAGFALFGKIIVNIWPIICGAWLYAVYRRESFMAYTPVALLATTLSPFVSYIALHQHDFSLGYLVLALVSGLVIGFAIVPLATHTFRIQNGMNLYNMGFAAGLLAMVLVSLLKAFGTAPESAYFWSSQYRVPLTVFAGIIILILIISSFIIDKRVLSGFYMLMKSRHKSGTDYLARFGAAPVMLNMGICGIIGLAYLWATGSDVNGPTLGAVFTIMGFAACGKNPKNIIPVMLGVLVGSLCNQWAITSPAVQLAGLFCTALTPISDYFGPIAGLAAGFFHSSVVLFAGSPLAGLNLYNNGFAAGIVSMVLYPVLSEIMKRRHPSIDDVEYMELFK